MNSNAKTLLVTSKVLKFCAYIFLGFGLVMFAYIYLTVYHDDPVRALTDPMFAVCILVPFLPAAVLAFASAKKHKQAMALIDAARGEEGKPPPEAKAA